MAAKQVDIEEREFLSTSTIAKLIDRSTDTVRREIQAGRLKAFRFNNDYAIRTEDFEEWKAKRFKPV